MLPKIWHRILFDLNHRATSGKVEEELSAAFKENCFSVGYPIGNEEDFSAFALVPKALKRISGKGIQGKIDSSEEMMEGIRDTYPNVSGFATTLH